MELFVYAVVLIVFVLMSYWFVQRKDKQVRAKWINAYSFPSTVSKNIQKKYPHLTDSQITLVLNGLREYFHLCNLAERQMVAMPSQVVDVAWHEFILFTHQYNDFCKKGLRRFLHHTPVEAMQSQMTAQNSIKTAWRLACERENINPQSAHKLPLLFALDSLLEIPDGFRYSLNCGGPGNHDYCAAHIGCGGGSDNDGCTGGDSSGCGGGD